MSGPHDLSLGAGATFSRQCPKCRCTVAILTPEKNGHGGDPARRKRWCNLVRAQIPWPLLCEDCKRWWNLRVGGPEHNPEPELTP